MIRFLPFLVIAAVGCARPEPYHAYDLPALKTADERERDLHQNLRDDRTWEEQQQMMADVKAAFGGSSNSDAMGPVMRK